MDTRLVISAFWETEKDQEFKSNLSYRMRSYLKKKKEKTSKQLSGEILSQNVESYLLYAYGCFDYICVSVPFVCLVPVSEGT